MRTFNSYNEMAVANGSVPYIPMNLRNAACTENMSPELIPLQPIQGYKFTMYGEAEGPQPHVHVKAPGNKYAEIWLSPEIAVKDAGNMRRDELNAVMKLIAPNKDTFIQQYQKYKPLPGGNKQRSNRSERKQK